MTNQTGTGAAGGMDSTSAALLLDSVKHIKGSDLPQKIQEEQTGKIHDIVKALKKDEKQPETITKADEIYQRMGYVPGAYVQYLDSPTLGVITGFNTSTHGFYPGDRYPVYVKFGSGEYQYSIFATHYEKVGQYEKNPKKMLKDFTDDLHLKVVDIKPEVAEKVIEKQEEWKDKSVKELIELADSEEYKNIDLPYIKDRIDKGITNPLWKISVDEIIQLYMSAGETAKKILEDRLIKIGWKVDGLSHFVDNPHYSALSDTIKDHIQKSLKEELQALDGEKLMKMLDDKKVGEKTKEIIRGIIEAK